MINPQKQSQLRAFVEREVLANQTMLVVWLLQAGRFDETDIENLYPQTVAASATCGECGDEHTAVDETGTCTACRMPQAIYEWWLVTDWLAQKLKACGEPILTNAYGLWWGRTCSGQAIYLDSVIEMLYDALR